MAIGASVFRIRIELIFRRCWNLITPRESAGLRRRACGVSYAADSLARAAGTWRPVSQTRTRRAFLEFGHALIGIAAVDLGMELGKKSRNAMTPPAS